MIGDFAEGDGPAEFASPACFMHEVDPSYSGLGAHLRSFSGGRFCDGGKANGSA